MNKSALTCYDRTDLYRPQWAFDEPVDAHDELFIVGPFSLPVAGDGTLSLNLPVQLDDDVQFYIRAVYFGELNPATGFLAEGGILARLRDCYGNMLTQGLILALGAWGSAIDGVNAFGFTLEQEVECSPGGTLLFDFQVGRRQWGVDYLASHSGAQPSVVGGRGRPCCDGYACNQRRERNHQHVPGRAEHHKQHGGRSGGDVRAVLRLQPAYGHNRASAVFADGRL